MSTCLMLSLLTLIILMDHFVSGKGTTQWSTLLSLEKSWRWSINQCCRKWINRALTWYSSRSKDRQELSTPCPLFVYPHFNYFPPGWDPLCVRGGQRNKHMSWCYRDEVIALWKNIVIYFITEHWMKEVHTFLCKVNVRLPPASG